MAKTGTKRIRTTVDSSKMPVQPEVKKTESAELVDFYVMKPATSIGMGYLAARYKEMNAKDARKLQLEGFGMYWKDFCEKEGINPNEA